MVTLAEKITTTTDAPAPIIVKGNTTEQVLRALLSATEATDPWPIIHELVARYDAKALRRAAKATQSEEEG